ncbi:MAG: NAD(P)H-quinone oxidoreductase [Burkholderiales bacterium]
MRAIEIKHGKLVLGERPMPLPNSGEVLVKAAAAGVNRADILQRKGLYPPPPGTSDILGLEVAGVVEKLGGGVSTWRAGDPVCALLTGGGYADYCVAAASNCLPIPKGLGFIEAAALPETFFTVWGSVFDVAKLSEGETLLVTGGTSGIGVTAIQMAHALGNRVFALAGSAEKCTKCEKLGAERAINYRNQDWVAILKDATGDKGVDVVLDMAGGEMLSREVAALAPDGRIALIGFMAGAKTTIDLAEFLFKRASLRAFTLRSRPNEFKAVIASALRNKVWPLIESGKIKPVVHATFPFDAATQAHALMESGSHIGKIVLTPE